MHLHRIDIGAIQQRLIRGRVIGLYGLDQFELAQNRDAPRRGVIARGRRIVSIGSFEGRRGR
jgi:hypothetical protein